MSIDKLEPFLGDAYESRPHLRIFKYLIKKKNLWQRDYNHIWTEIDLD